jgi:hypothetical protein
VAFFKRFFTTNPYTLFNSITLPPAIRTRPAGIQRSPALLKLQKAWAQRKRRMEASGWQSLVAQKLDALGSPPRGRGRRVQWDQDRAFWLSDTPEAQAAQKDAIMREWLAANPKPTTEPVSQTTAPDPDILF